MLIRLNSLDREYWKEAKMGHLLVVMPDRCKGENGQNTFKIWKEARILELLTMKADYVVKETVPRNFSPLVF
jgi:hypothetical protein